MLAGFESRVERHEQRWFVHNVRCRTRIDQKAIIVTTRVLSSGIGTLELEGMKLRCDTGNLGSIIVVSSSWSFLLLSVNVFERFGEI